VTGSSWNRRHRLEIIHDILKAAEQGCRVTSIVYRVNINSKLAKKYVNLLLETGMLELRNNPKNDLREIYMTTGKAKEFVRTYRYLMEGLQPETLASQSW